MMIEETDRIFGDGWDLTNLDLIATEGGCFTVHLSPDDTRATVQDFVAQFETRFGSRPDALAVLAYDAATIMFQDMVYAKTTDDPLKVAQAVEDSSFPTVSSNISYDTLHNPVKAAAVLKIENGKIIFVDIIAP